ncbi:MAG: sporulation protein YabP [Clostridia bacterium]|nr:sporulation protein YabP [Clostridia bacterium]
MEEIIKQNSNIILENRKSFTASGIRECISFDDETVVLDTALGLLTLKGERLHIINFDTKTGDISIEGKFHAIVYTAQKSGGSFFGKIFK